MSHNLNTQTQYCEHEPQNLYDQMLAIYSQFREEQDEIQRQFDQIFMGLLEDIKTVTDRMEESAQEVNQRMEESAQLQEYLEVRENLLIQAVGEEDEGSAYSPIDEFRPLQSVHSRHSSRGSKSKSRRE